MNESVVWVGSVQVDEAGTTGKCRVVFVERTWLRAEWKNDQGEWHRVEPRDSHDFVVAEAFADMLRKKLLER
jgi:hypothetical protein